MRKKMFQHATTVTFKEKMWEDLNEIAEQEDSTRADVIRDFLKMGISQYKGKGSCLPEVTEKVEQ